MTLAIIQARLGSSRLPRKALMDIHGKPMLQHVVERVRQIRGVEEMVLAVPKGDVWHLAYYSARTEGPDVPDDDVLGRFAAVLEQYPDADPIMRISGDCPLLSPAICEQVLALYQQTPGCEYAWNVTPGYVDGEDCEVFSRRVLLQAHHVAKDAFDREHVTPWIRRHYSVTTLPVSPMRVHWGSTSDRPTLKTSVDTFEDLERVRLLCQTS